jgi:branched-chain amino acid transport system permease protein
LWRGRPVSAARCRHGVSDAGEAARWRRALAGALLGGPAALPLPFAAALFLIAFPLVSRDPYWIREISLIAVLGLVVSGLNFTFGLAGEPQFAQVFAFALGCYVTMIVSIRVWDEVVPLLILGGVTAAAAGALIGLAATRIAGWALTLTSFFLVIIIPDVASIFQAYTGGLNGLVTIPYPHLLGSPEGSTGLYEITVCTTVVWFALYRNIVTSRYGVLLRTLRHSTVLANSLGFSTLRLKILTHSLGAFPAGMAGCLFGFISLVVAPSSFDLTLAIGVVAASILGGTESIYGALIAAGALELAPESSLSFQQYAPIAYGVFLIVAAVMFRGGLSGLGRATARRASRRVVGPGRVRRISAGIPPSDVLERAARVEALATGLGCLDGLPLAVSSVSKRFGRADALTDVSLTARPGEVTGLIGANGSGKTTLLNVISGFSKAEPGGAITLGGRSIAGLAPQTIARAGVSRTFQTPSIPRGVSTVDVVASGRFHLDRSGIIAAALRLPRHRRSRRHDRQSALAALELVGLAEIADEEAVSQSLGTRRLVEVARALCSRPRLLLLDEPASGLSYVETERLADIVKAAAAAGAAVVLIEHNLEFVESVADVTHVLHSGALASSGAGATIARDPAVHNQAGTSRRDVRTRAADVLRLELQDIESGYDDRPVLHSVSLRLWRGRIEAVLGPNGAGKTTLLGTIAGLVSIRSGTLTLDGVDVGRIPAHRRAAAGIALVQDGKRIFRERTVRENIVLGTFSQPLSRRERGRLCDGVLAQFAMLEDRSRELAGDLSGGQQQMLAIAQALAARPRALLLDEPSAGLAPGLVPELFESIRRLADDGMAVVLVEQLAREAVAVADHVTVMDNGEVVDRGAPGRVPT